MIKTAACNVKTEIVEEFTKSMNERQSKVKEYQGAHIDIKNDMNWFRCTWYCINQIYEKCSKSVEAETISQNRNKQWIKRELSLKYPPCHLTHLFQRVFH